MFSTRTKFKYVLIESYVPEHTGEEHGFISFECYNW